MCAAAHGRHHDRGRAAGPCGWCGAESSASSQGGRSASAGLTRAAAAAPSGRRAQPGRDQCAGCQPVCVAARPAAGPVSCRAGREGRRRGAVVEHGGMYVTRGRRRCRQDQRTCSSGGRRAWRWRVLRLYRPTPAAAGCVSALSGVCSVMRVDDGDDACVDVGAVSAVGADVPMAVGVWSCG